MQSQYGWNTQGAMPVRPSGARNVPWMDGSGGVCAGGPYSYPGPRSAQLPVRPVNSGWAPSTVRNEDFGNLVSRGFGPAWQGEHPVANVASSPHSTSCCSPPGADADHGGWISPMDDQPIYLSPVLLQNNFTPHFGAFVHVPSFSARSQGSISDSEDETVSARSPDSGSYLHHTSSSHHTQANVFEMDMDEPSTTTTAGDDEDAEEETTYDEASEAIWDDAYAEDLDTTVDYSFLRGAIESPLEVEDFPGTQIPPIRDTRHRTFLPFSKTRFYTPLSHTSGFSPRKLFITRQGIQFSHWKQTSARMDHSQARKHAPAVLAHTQTHRRDAYTDTPTHTPTH